MILSRDIKPMPGKNISFSLPEIEKFNLANGLEVLYIQKNKLPIMRLNLITRAGSKFDPQNKKGLANLFAMSIDEGAGDYSSLELSEEFNYLGTSFNANSNKDRVNLSIQTLTENFDRSLELFSMIIRNPHFNEDDILRQKRKVLTKLIQLKDEPEKIADLIFSYNLWGDHNPYAFPVNGYENDVTNISSEDVKNHFLEYFTPENSTLVAVGNLGKDEFIKKLNTNLSDWHVKNNAKKIEIKTKKTQRLILLIDKKNSVQSEIRVGHIASPRDNKEFFKKLVLNTILGGQFTSRINLNLRENKGYTYGASSSFGYYDNGGFFLVSTSVGIENTANSLKEIIFELNHIKEGITTEELDFAKSFLIRQFPSNFETYGQMASNLSILVAHSLPNNYFNTYMDNLASVSIDDINSIAKESIFPDKLIIVVVGDSEKLLPQLKEAKFEDIVVTDYMGIPIKK